jgi:hypothetical protein
MLTIIERRRAPARGVRRILSRSATTLAAMSNAPRTTKKAWRPPRRTGFKVTDKGPVYFEFTDHRAYAIRPLPARVWTTALDGPARWVGLRTLPFSLAGALRELRDEDAGAPVPQRPYFVRRRANLRRFVAFIPARLQDELVRWPHGAWGMYRLVSSSTAALELCATDEGAVVAWLLGHADHFVDGRSWRGQRPLAFARGLLRSKRREIVGALGFPATDATLRALVKVPRGDLDPKTARHLCLALWNEQLRARLAHLPVITASAVGTLVSTYADHVTDAFLREEPACADGDHVDHDAVARLLHDTAALARVRGRALPVLSSRAALHALHDELVEQVRRLQQNDKNPLPPLPVPLENDERDWVRPLGSLFAMAEEGVAMRHCLGTLPRHRAKAPCGQFHAFALSKDVRLTLGLEQRQLGRWCIYDLRGFANSVAPAWAWQWAQALVDRWNAARSALPGPDDAQPPFFDDDEYVPEIVGVDDFVDDLPF